MQAGRSSTFAFAVLSAAIGIWSLRIAYLLLGGSLDTLRAGEIALGALLLTSGVLCVVGAFVLVKRRLDRPRVTQPRDMPQFGRQAADSSGRGSPLAAVLTVAILAGAAGLAAQRFDLLRPVDVPVVASPVQDTATPAPTPPAPAPQQVQPTQVTQETSSAPSTPEPAPAAPAAGSAVQETAATPPTQPAVAAPEGEPDAPSVTTVPMPEQEALPSQADGHRDAVVWLSLSPDEGSFLSTSTDKTIKLWDLPGERLIRTVASHSDMARVAEFLPDGERIVTAGDDGDIVLRSLADGAPLHVFSTRDHGGVNKIAVSADGRRMVSGHEAGTVLFWDLEKRAALHVERAHGWPVAGVAISHDGRRALSGSIDGDLKLWNVESGDLIRYWGGHERGAYGMAFTRDGKRAVTGSGDRTIKLWDLESGRLVRQFDGHSQTVYAIALSDDDTRILSGSLDGTARLWDLENGTEIAQYVGHRGPVYSVAFGPEGTVLTGGYDRSIRIWREAGPLAVAVLAGAPQ
jgi:WD40 repeat protein